MGLALLKTLRFRFRCLNLDFWFSKQGPDWVFKGSEKSRFENGKVSGPIQPLEASITDGNHIKERRMKVHFQRKGMLHLI